MGSLSLSSLSEFASLWLTSFMLLASLPPCPTGMDTLGTPAAEATPPAVGGQQTRTMRPSPQTPSAPHCTPLGSASSSLPSQLCQANRPSHSWEHSHTEKGFGPPASTSPMEDPTHDRLLRALSVNLDEQRPSGPPPKSAFARRERAHQHFSQASSSSSSAALPKRAAKGVRFDNFDNLPASAPPLRHPAR